MTTATPAPSIRIPEDVPMSTTDALKAELAELTAANEAAPEWGAAVGARHERIREIEDELLRREHSTTRKAPDTRSSAEDPKAELRAQTRWGMKPLACPGVSRMADNEKAVLVSFSRRLTDGELRFFHEVCQRSAPLMEDR